MEGTRCVGRVVLLGELLDKGLCLLLVDGDAAVLLLLEPGEDAVTIEDLALVAELVRDRDACQVFLGLLHRRQRHRLGAACGERIQRRATNAFQHPRDQQGNHEESAEEHVTLLSFHQNPSLF